MPVEFQPERILAALAKHRVVFVVIGGGAAVFHGSPVPTNDIDIVPSDDSENWARLSAALTELDAQVRAGDETFLFDHDGESLAASQIWNLTTKYGALDITQRPSGTFGYADLKADAVPIKLGRITVQIASLQDIVRSKEAAGRDKDRRALPILRELVARQLRAESGRPAR